jgi:hypothetical protein
MQRQVRDQTYLRAMGDLFELAEGWKNPTEWAVDTFVTPWVPNVIKGALRESDRYVRNARVREMEGMTKSEAVIHRLPYKLLPSESIAPPPRHDVWGRRLERTPISLFNGILLERKLDSGDPLRLDALIWRWNEKVRRGAAGDEADTWAPSPPRPYTSVAGERIHWTDAEYGQLVRDVGQRSADDLLSRRLNWDDPTQEDIDTIGEVRSAYFRRVKAELLRARGGGRSRR